MQRTTSPWVHIIFFSYAALAILYWLGGAIFTLLFSSHHSTPTSQWWLYLIFIRRPTHLCWLWGGVHGCIVSNQRQSLSGILLRSSQSSKHINPFWSICYSTGHPTTLSDFYRFILAVTSNDTPSLWLPHPGRAMHRIVL